MVKKGARVIQDETLAHAKATAEPELSEFRY